MVIKARAAVAHSFRKPLRIEPIEIAEPGPTQVVVQIEASGVCHTDVAAVDGALPIKPALPLIPGHEGVGRVCAKGSEVKTLKEGDRVGVTLVSDSCRACNFCESGYEALCPRVDLRGYFSNGTFAEYVLADAAYTCSIPDNLLPEEAAPLLCAGVTAYRAVNETQVQPGEWLVILGVGGVGHLAVQFAKAKGLQVAAVDVHDDKLQLAQASGADLVINSKTDDAIRNLKAAIGGAAGTLVTTSNASAFSDAIEMTSRNGTCVMVGIPLTGSDLPIFDVVVKGLTIRGSMFGNRQDLHEALALAAAGTVRPQVQLLPFSAVNKVMDDLRCGRISGRSVLKLA